MSSMEITQLLQRIQNEPKTLDVVIPLVYDELKRLARAHLRREVNAMSMQTTALVHEAFLKLAGSRQPAYENRSHFYGIASKLMRQVLVDMARARSTVKRGSMQEIPLSEAHGRQLEANRPVLALEDALRRLEQADPIKGRLIEMRFFGGMTAKESSEALSMSVPAVRRELRLAQAWLRKEMAAGELLACS